MLRSLAPEPDQTEPLWQEWTDLVWAFAPVLIGRCYYYYSHFQISVFFQWEQPCMISVSRKKAKHSIVLQKNGVFSSLFTKSSSRFSPLTVQKYGQEIPVFKKETSWEIPKTWILMLGQQELSKLVAINKIIWQMGQNVPSSVWFGHICIKITKGCGHGTSSVCRYWGY